MSKPEPIEPGKVQPTYSGFLILRINEIWGAWKDDDPEKALWLAIQLADTFLIRKIKKKLERDIQVIRKELSAAYNVKSYDFFTTQLERNKASRRVADRYLGSFLSKMSDLIDEWGYYELPHSSIRSLILLRNDPR